MGGGYTDVLIYDENEQLFITFVTSNGDGLWSSSDGYFYFSSNGKDWTSTSPYSFNP